MVSSLLISADSMVTELPMTVYTSCCQQLSTVTTTPNLTETISKTFCMWCCAITQTYLQARKGLLVCPWCTAGDSCLAGGRSRVRAPASQTSCVPFFPLSLPSPWKFNMGFILHSSHHLRGKVRVKSSRCTGLSCTE